MPDEQTPEADRLHRDPVYKAIVFDFDGTLLDSMMSFADTAAVVMEEFFALERREGRRRYLETSGLPFRLQLEEIFPGDKRNDEAAEIFEGRKMTAITPACFFPETKEVIETLRNEGVLVVVSSNNFAVNVKGLLHEVDIQVDMILSYHPGFYKGDPHFSMILKRWELERSTILYVGDSLKDAGWSKEYGVDFVGRTGTFSGEQFRESFPGFRVVDDLKDILPMVFSGRKVRGS